MLDWPSVMEAILRANSVDLGEMLALAGNAPGASAATAASTAGDAPSASSADGLNLMGMVTTPPATGLPSCNIGFILKVLEKASAASPKPIPAGVSSSTWQATEASVATMQWSCTLPPSPMNCA